MQMNGWTLKHGGVGVLVKEWPSFRLEEYLKHINSKKRERVKKIGGEKIAYVQKL